MQTQCFIGKQRNSRIHLVTHLVCKFKTIQGPYIVFIPERHQTKYYRKIQHYKTVSVK